MLDMTAKGMTITLPERLAKRVQDEARRSGRPVSRIMADAVKAQEDANLREFMIQGSRESSKLNKELAEEGMPLFREVLGIDPKG